MCYLVTIGTRDTQATIETLLTPEASLALRPSTNPSVRALFPAGDQLVEISDGMCACSLVIQRTQKPVAEQRARLRARYAAKGWSETKMGRALTDWETNHERRSSKETQGESQLCALLRTLASRSGGVRVFVHFYDGAFDGEVVSAAARTRVRADQLSGMAVIGHDQLVDVVPHGG